MGAYGCLKLENFSVHFLFAFSRKLQINMIKMVLFDAKVFEYNKSNYEIGSAQKSTSLTCIGKKIEVDGKKNTRQTKHENTSSHVDMLFIRSEAFFEPKWMGNERKKNTLFVDDGLDTMFHFKWFFSLLLSNAERNRNFVLLYLHLLHTLIYNYRWLFIRRVFDVTDVAWKQKTTLLKAQEANWIWCFQFSLSEWNICQNCCFFSFYSYLFSFHIFCNVYVWGMTGP